MKVNSVSVIKTLTAELSRISGVNNSSRNEPDSVQHNNGGCGVIVSCTVVASWLTG